MSRPRVLVFLLLAACSQRETEPPAMGDGGGPPTMVDAATEAPTLRLGDVSPVRGPHTGGFRVVLSGASFDGELRVFVDGAEASGLTVLAPGRVAVTFPARAPGVVDIEVRRFGEQASLEDAFTYDAIAVEPAVGATHGGLPVTIRGYETQFAAGDDFEFDGAACGGVEVLSSTEARCRVPQATTPGLVSVAQRRGSETLAAAPEAFRYVEETLNTGGIAGGAIDGRLDVRVSGLGPIEDAHVEISYGDPPQVLTALTDADGLATFEAPDLRGPVDVHAGERCYHRTSFLGVDASQVALPLARFWQRTEGCPPAGPPGLATARRPPGVISGRVVFVDGLEFRTPTRRWNGVPEAREGDRRVALLGAAVDLDYFDALRAGENVGAFEESDWDESLGGYPFRMTVQAGTNRICAQGGTAPVDESLFDLLAMANSGESSFRSFIAGCSRAVFVPPESEVTDVLVELTVPTTGRLDVELGPLDATGLLYAPSPARTVSAAAPGVGSIVEVLPPDVAVYPSIDESWRPRLSTAPTTYRAARLPLTTGWWTDRLLLVSAGWSFARGTGSGVIAQPGTLGTLRLEPLPIPHAVEPAVDERIARHGGVFRFALEADVDLVWVRLEPQDTNDSPNWNLFGPGALRDVHLPTSAELALDPVLYRVEVAAEEREGFDYRQWSLLETIVFQRPDRQSIVTRYFRSER